MAEEIERLTGRRPEPLAVLHYVRGLLERLRLRGGLANPLLEPFVKSGGKRWFLWGGRPDGLPPFTPDQGHPRFYTTAPKGDLDPISALVGPIPTWLTDWGATPAIQFEASAGNEHFCFIRIHRYDNARLIVSQKQARAPHCPHCNKPVKNWQASKTEETIHCNQCNSSANIENFDWRKMAGYGRMFIEITDIFPKEAIPQQVLLKRLADITGVAWVYFYSCK